MNEDVLASYRRFFQGRGIIFYHELNFLYYYLNSIALYCGKYKELAEDIKKDIVNPISLLYISPLLPNNPELFSHEGRFIGSPLGIEMLQPWSWFIPSSNIDEDLIPILSLIESLIPIRSILDIEWIKSKREIKKEIKKSKEELFIKGKKYGIQVDIHKLWNPFFRWKVVKILSWLED